jgi:hypothetical protein
MPTRPFTDISVAVTGEPIKNGTLINTTTRTGYYSTYDRYVSNVPASGTIANKYGYRFYNGIFVELVGDQTVIGG